MREEALLQQLQDDLNLASQLLELTEQELSALTDRDMPRLEAVLTQKQPLLALLAQHGNQRHQLLSSQGLPSTRDGLAQLVANRTDANSIINHADSLGAMLEECRNANLRNGRLIRANQNAVGSMLNILRGSQDTPTLYNSRGGSNRGSSNRPLSQA